MRTSEVAELAGVGVETLRYYERRGLLEPPQRSSGGYRAYSPEAVRVVRFVKRAQRVGFTLDDIAELLRLAKGGPRSCATARSMARTRLSELDRRIADLFVAVVIALLVVAAYLPQRPALVLDGVAAGASGLWCAANFWRCRHAHCLVTGAGWSLLGLCYLAEAGLGHSFVAGYEQPIFLGVLIVGLLFEGYWTVRYGSNAVT